MRLYNIGSIQRKKEFVIIIEFCVEIARSIALLLLCNLTCGFLFPAKGMTPVEASAAMTIGNIPSHSGVQGRLVLTNPASEQTNGEHEKCLISF